LDGRRGLFRGHLELVGFRPGRGANAGWPSFGNLFALISVLLLCTVAFAQGDPSGMSNQPGSQDQGGAATGKPHSAVRDKQNRVITAGGFVDGAPVVFENLTSKSHLDSFLHHSGTPQKKFIPETLGSGVGILDYDNDGWPDIYFVNGGSFDSVKGKAPAPAAALFHNNHDGTFTDVTTKAGVANDRWGFGVAVGDFDNDGWPDLYVTNFGKNRLYRNNHNGTFTDIGERAGVALGGWSTGATFGDYDGDGRLDLFVSGYVKFDLDNPPVAGSPQVKGNYCGYRGQTVMCGPRGLAGEQDHLFHNNGDGTFTDVSVKAGVNDPSLYYGLGTAFADIDNDGRLDLIVANDSTPRYLYRNRGDGTFEDISYVSGFALNEEGRAQASMGIAIGDYNNDGLLDLFVTDFSDDNFTLYRNDGNDNFTDVSFQAGIGEATIPFLGWGTVFLDYDNDGWLDLFMANGHTYPDADHYDWGTTYQQRPLLFRNLRGARFELMPAATGSGLADILSGRGVACADLFNDGHMDVVLNNLDSPPTLLRNVVKNENHWVSLKLIGGTGSPRDAIGAKAMVTAGGMRIRRDVISGGSYDSSSDLRVHFGLGTNKRVEKMEIQWPSGKKEEVRIPAVDRFYTVTERQGRVQEK
jgi:hypothetical protein